MQPPQMRTSLKQQVDQLIARANQQAAVTPLMQPGSTNSCMNLDYKQLIQQWFDKEPPTLRNRKYSMTEFIMRFAGRFRPKPAARLIADALRELGWT